ncbi:MAG TPA: cohesin domain-containing protein, partial [Terriglobales bacterium]|nr:cohesin domain-containing protein [Terriglobales bacterium]
ALGAVLQREFDSASGIVALAAGEFGPAPAGTFELGRIRVRALRAGNTTVSLATEPGRQSDVTFGGASVLTDLSPLSLAIATSGVELAVVAPQSVVRVGDEINVTIEARTGVKQVDGVAAYLDFDPTIFEVVSVSAGTNLPAVIYRSFDNRKGSVDLAVGTLGAFPSGNISVGVVRLRAIGGPTETTVTFASLTSRQSDVTFAGQSLLAIAHDVTFQVATGDVVLAVVAPPTVDGGRSFALQLEVRAGNQPVDGAAAYLDFDPATFRVLRIVPGTALSTEIEASFDNSAGRVNFIAGDLDNIPSGTFTLATLELLPLRAITASDLRFSVNLPRRSDASYSGTSVLLTRSGARIAVQGPVCFLDLDATGGAPTAETDGYWLYRNLVGLRAVPSATRASNPTLIADASIAAVIDAIRPALDFDGDGQPRAATDAVYLHRLLDGQTPVVPDLFRTAGAPASETVSDAIRNLCCLPELGCVQESAAATCIGDCGGNDRVSVEELISGVSIALGTTSIEQCSTLDANLDAVVTVDELLLAADQALHGCPESGVHFSAATGAATR